MFQEEIVFMRIIFAMLELITLSKMICKELIR